MHDFSSWDSFRIGVFAGSVFGRRMAGGRCEGAIPATWLPARLAAACCLALAALSARAAVQYEFVTVGDAGNAADTSGFGAVDYEYRIGKYEVTIGQYCEFLNAVAQADTYGLYNTNMGTDANVAGISRTGTDGAYGYSVLGPSGVVNGQSAANRPIAYVSGFNAARFANWMANGQPTGAQGPGTTETGAYTLDGRTTGVAPIMKSGATFYIPLENEWYKAAYYSPLLNSGSGAYWYYATQSNSRPGNTIGSASDQANWSANDIMAVTRARYVSSQNCLTDVGAFTNSASYYGTFDQSGNVQEWNAGNGTTTPGLGVRGGAWNNNFSDGFNGAWYLSSDNYNYYFEASDASAFRGFRLAAPVAVPEPSTSVMALAGLASGAWALRRRKTRRVDGRLPAA